MKILNLIASLSLFFGVCISYGQSKHAYIESIGAENGLSSFNIQDIFQDRRGFIWMVSADNGLFRYDGVNIKNITKEQDGLVSNFLSVAAEDANGMLWVIGGATAESLRDISILDPLTRAVQSIKVYVNDSLPFKIEDIVHLQSNQDQSIWLFDNRNKIYEWDGTTLQYWGLSPSSFFRTSPSLVFQNLKIKNDLLGVDKHGKRIYYLDSVPEVLQLDDNPEGYSTYISALGIDSNQTIYGSYYRHYYHLFWQKKDQQTVEPIGPVITNGNTLLEYHQDHFYLVTDSNICIYNLDFELKYQLDVQLTDRKDLFFDRQGGFWCIKKDRIYHIMPSESPFPLFAPKSRANPRGVIEDREGNIYVSDFFGVYQYADSGQLVYQNRIKDFHFYGMTMDAEGIIWATIDHHGLLSYNSQKQQSQLFLAKRSIELSKALVFWQPYMDQNNRLWVGSSEGLWYLDRASATVLPWQENSKLLNNCTVYYLYENAKGLWLCTSQGLYLLDKTYQIKAHYHTKGKEGEHLPHDHISHLHETTDGDFWLSTKGGGLIHWNPNTATYQQFTTKEGLSHNILYAVYEDQQGSLWLPSHSGLMRFDQSTKTVSTFLKEDGLPNNEFNTTSHFQDSKGYYYFGTIDGMIRFHPNHFRKETRSYSFQITDFLKQNIESDQYSSHLEELLATNELVLETWVKSFELKFAALDYRSTKRNRYAYQIKGFDKTWNYLEDPVIRMNKLPYGNYELLLKVQVAGLDWKIVEQPITIRSLRPFYLQWWFVVLVILSLALGLFQLFRWRLSRLQQRQEVLELMVEQRTNKINEDKQIIEQQANDLLALDKIKSRFFTNISHELRTPLTLILGPLSYIIDHPEELNKPQTIQRLSIMQRNGKSLLNLIEEILDLSKLEAQKLTLKEEPTALQTYIHRIFSAFESQAKYQSINYQLSYLLSPDLVVLLDQNKIEKIINNLLSNALKFTPKSGQVHMEVGGEQGVITVNIKDTGKGIHADDLPNIFDRFYQAKNEKQVAEGGTGIGLALAKELSELMGGSLTVASKVGIETSFLLKLPKKITNQPIPPALQEAQKVTTDDILEVMTPIASKQFTILLVEDNHDMRNFVGSLLLPHYHLLTAANGREGLEILASNTDKISLIISDVMMPELDGFEMMRQIKQNPRWQLIPMMMLTARATEQDKLTALTVGVDDYLIKPFSVPELIARTQNLLLNNEQRLLFHQAEQSKLSAEAEPLPMISKADQEWVKEVESYLNDRLDTEFDNASLAQVFNKSKRQFERRLKKVTGLTPAKFIKEIRLQAARKHLEKGTFLSVTEVAYTVGFLSLGTFSKAYVKRFGKNPSTYKS